MFFMHHSAFEIQMQSTSAIKCLSDSRIFQFASATRRQKVLPKTQQKPLYITSAMASACLGILPKAMIWFFNSRDYLFYLNYIIYLYETEGNISLVDHLVLVFSSCGLAIAGEHIIQCYKSPALKI